MCVYIHIYIMYICILYVCVYIHIYIIYILYQCLLMQSIPTWWNVGAGVPLVHLMASQKVGSTCSTGDALGPGCRFQLCHSRQRNPIITYIYIIHNICIYIRCMKLVKPPAGAPVTYLRAISYFCLEKHQDHNCDLETRDCSASHVWLPEGREQL